jgi:hypothetical protein
MAKGKTTIILAVVFSFPLVFIANNVSAMSISFVEGVMGGVTREGIALKYIMDTEQYAGSAKARDDDESDSDSFSVSYPFPTDYDVWVEVTDALGYSGAHLIGLPDVMVYAQADWPDNQWAMAEADGWYRIDFIALESGLLEIEFDYEYRMSLETESPSEDAWAAFDVWVSLSGETDAVTHTDPTGPFDEFWSGSLNLSKEFEEGESGFYEVYFGAHANAVSIPDPSTLLLLGSACLIGLAGTGRRKFKN